MSVAKKSKMQGKDRKNKDRKKLNLIERGKRCNIQKDKEETNEEEKRLVIEKGKEKSLG